MAYIYEQPDGSVAICNLQSSIPEGASFSILNEIPQDKDLRDAWKMGIGKIDYDLVKAKTIKKAEAKQEAEALVKTITDNYEASEIATWDIQEAEARGEKPDNFLLELATASGETLADLKTNIIAKADAYKTLSAQAIGRRKAKEKAVDSATTIEELKGIIF